MLELLKLKSALLIFSKAIEKESKEVTEAYCKWRLGLDDASLDALLSTVESHKTTPWQELKGNRIVNFKWSVKESLSTESSNHKSLRIVFVLDIVDNNGEIVKHTIETSVEEALDFW